MKTSVNLKMKPSFSNLFVFWLKTPDLEKKKSGSANILVITQQGAQGDCLKASHTEGCGQCHTQMDGQWETWQPVAASRFVPLHRGHYVTVCPSGRTLGAICSCPWLPGCMGSDGGQEGEAAGGPFVCGASACCQEKRWFMNRGIDGGYDDCEAEGREGDGNASFMWRRRRGVRHLYDQLIFEPAQKESRRTESVRRETESLELIQQLSVTFSRTAATDDTQHPSMTNNTREPFISH